MYVLYLKKIHESKAIYFPFEMMSYYIGQTVIKHMITLICLINVEIKGLYQYYKNLKAFKMH